MSITSSDGKLMIVVEAAKTIPSNRPGRTVSQYSMVKWITRGAKLKGGGRLKLKAVYAPGGWLTSGAWIAEFLEALTANRNGHLAPSPDAEVRAAKAMARLQARGFDGKKKGRRPGRPA